MLKLINKHIIIVFRVNGEVSKLLWIIMMYNVLLAPFDALVGRFITWVDSRWLGKQVGTMQLHMH